ncbi:metallophosphoesterase [Psychroserpens luteolus]|uniref:metallophosphoesterase n=1 Tax=Psychroserpens luteolus TaxID=2855840 RepID=UPI001E408C31|nr:metallophosphoesterase [Psychroserpens luteolus]MCD2259046.1 metallophosphoesterase [Psychroserpens luteolus]
MKSVYLFAFCLFCFVSFSCKDDKKIPEPNIDKPNIEEDITSSLFKTANFLTLSDVHLDKSQKNVPYGDINSTGIDIWNRTLTEINTVAATVQPKFMVYLGDVPNYFDNTTGNIRKVFKDLRTLKGDYPILFLPGNNDTMEGDYHSFQDAPNPNGVNVFSLDKSTTDPWPIINRNSTTTKVNNLDFSKQFGFYAVDLIVGTETLHVIALNSVIFCEPTSTHQYIDDDNVTQQKAAQKQFSWFEKKLDSYGAKDHVMIVMHIPPGYDGYGQGKMWNDDLYVKNKDSVSYRVQNNFLRVLGNNKGKLRGMLTSHTHLDGLRRLYADDTFYKKDMVALSISTPGISVYHSNNPGFKSFSYDISNFDLIDFTTYYAEPTAKSGNHHYEDQDFKYQSKSYTFKETYDIKDPKMTIFSAINGMQHRHIINAYTKQILYVNSNDKRPTEKFDFDLALDVIFQK